MSLKEQSMKVLKAIGLTVLEALFGTILIVLLLGIEPIINIGFGLISCLLIFIGSWYNYKTVVR